MAECLSVLQGYALLLLCACCSALLSAGLGLRESGTGGVVSGTSLGPWKSKDLCLVVVVTCWCWGGLSAALVLTHVGRRSCGGWMRRHVPLTRWVAFGASKGVLALEPLHRACAHLSQAGWKKCTSCQRWQQVYADRWLSQLPLGCECGIGALHSRGHLVMCKQAASAYRGRRAHACRWRAGVFCS